MDRLFGRKAPEGQGGAQKAEREFFGGETMEEAAKKEEAEAVETMPYNELLKKVRIQSDKVKESLAKEKDLSAEIL